LQFTLVRSIGYTDGKLERIQNIAARKITNTKRHDLLIPEFAALGFAHVLDPEQDASFDFSRL